MLTTTRIPVTRWAFALLLAVAVLGVSGCTDASTGSPLPTSSSQGEHTSSSAPTSSENAAARLAAIDPCTLLTQVVLDQYGLRKRDSGNIAGARICSWSHPTDENGKGGFNLKPGIWDHQGLKDINTNGYSVTDVLIGKHQARQAKDTVGDACFVAIGVTDSSRVDVVASGDPGQGCRLANEFARLIEPKLPGGSE